MIAYGIEVLPIIRELQDAHHCIIQPWYADYEGAGVSFDNLMAHLKDLHGKRPLQCYFLELTKSILVGSTRIVDRYEDFLCGMKLDVVTRSHYFDGFIGNWDAKGTWLEDNVQGWAESVRTLSVVACKHLQTAYSGLHNSLQH